MPVVINPQQYWSHEYFEASKAVETLKLSKEQKTKTSLQQNILQNELVQMSLR